MLFALNQLGQTDSILGAAQKMIAGGIPEGFGRAVAAGGRAAGAGEGAGVEGARRLGGRAESGRDRRRHRPVGRRARSTSVVSSYQIAADLIPHVQTLTSSTKAADKALACTEAKQSEDLLAKTSIAMPRGASVDKTAAAQILTNVGSLERLSSAQVKKAFCK